MIPAPTTTNSSPLADWVELSCFKTANADRISRSDVADQVARYSLTGAPDDLVTNVWAELTRRARVPHYPFQVESHGLTRKGPWQQFVVYTMLTLLGTAGYHRKSKIRSFKEPAAIFEELVRLGLERYLGGRAVRIGHPRRPPVPSSFPKLLEYMSRELGEVLVRSQALIAQTKDCRADVVAWKPFADKRSGQLIVLAQCAIGADWQSKLSELSIDLWRLYISFVVPPMRAFAIPFIEPHSEHWLEYGTRGGIAFDRLRISEMLTGIPLEQKLERSMKKWSRAQMKRVPWDD